MPGPVAAAFYRDRANVSAIMGPIGSGKTTVAGPLKTLAIAAEENVESDGWRRTHFAFLRDTYRNLVGSTIPTWQQWVSPAIGGWEEGPPARHVVRQELEDGSRVEAIVSFLGIGDARIEELTRGREFTAAYLGEVDTMHPNVLQFMRGRVGRYRLGQRRPKWSGVWCDLNAPEFDHWCVKLFDTDRPKGFSFFRQPSGLAPDAENIHILGPDYYRNQMEGAPDWYVRRMIKNEYGFSRAGKPVYPEFSDAWHISKEPLQATRGLPCRLAGDAGRTPAILLIQDQPNGQIFVLDELIYEGGARALGRAILRWLGEKWPHVDVTHGMGDPAGDSMSSTEETTYWAAVEEECAISWVPAPSNLRTPREEAMRDRLDTNIDGKPAILISMVCTMLRRAMNFGFRFKRMERAEGRYEDQPEKNEYSHVAEAGEYGCMDRGGYRGTVKKRQREAGRPRQLNAIDLDNPGGTFEGGGHVWRGGRQLHAD